MTSRCNLRFKNNLVLNFTDYWAPIPWILIYILWRLTHLLCTNPTFVFLGSPMEELYRGTIAREILLDRPLPLLDYQADHYSGGSLVMGLVASVFFKLLGPTLFALKMAPLLLSSLSLYFWYLTLSRNIGKVTAQNFSFLFTFSPPTVTGFSVLALGDHAETIFFSSLCLFLLMEIVYQKKSGWIYFALLGFTAGFGLWFAYIFVLTLLTLVFVGFIHRKEIPQTGFWIALIFFVAGFSPWIYLTVKTNFATFFVYNRPLSDRFSVGRFWDTIATKDSVLIRIFTGFVLENWPYSGILRESLSFFYSAVYALPILGFILIRFLSKRFARMFSQNIRRPMAAPFIFLIFFVLAVQASDFRTYRFKVPMWAFLFSITAFSLAQLCRRYPWKKARPLYLSAIVAASILAQIMISSPAAFGKIFSMKGYSYYSLPSTPVCKKTSDCLRVYEKLWARLDPGDLFDLSAATALHLVEQSSDHDPLRSPQHLQQKIYPALLPYLAFFFGQQSVSHTTSFSDLQNVLSQFRFNPPLDKPAMLGAINALPETSWIYQSQFLRDIQNLEFAYPEFSGEVWRAGGQIAAARLHTASKGFPTIPDSLPADIPPLSGAAYYQGIGMFLFFSRLIDRTAVISMPEGIRRKVLSGIGAGFALTHLYCTGPEERWRHHEFLNSLSKGDREAVNEGVFEQFQIFQSMGIHLAVA